jgi:hypothetical protein
MAAPHVRSLLHELAKNGKILEGGQDDAARKAMIEAAGKLILALEGPGEMLTRIGWGEVRSRLSSLFSCFGSRKKGHKRARAIVAFVLICVYPLI